MKKGHEIDFFSVLCYNLEHVEGEVSMENIKNFVVFNSQVKHGQMNSAKAFYPGLEDNATERTRLMRQHKQTIADEVGFDINDIFMSLQSDKNHQYIPGTTYTITEEDITKYEDLYYYDVWADTIKLTRKTPGVVIGFNVSDGANVIAMNTSTLEATSTFCSGAHINKGVPFTIASNLGGNPEDIMVDVSPFAYSIPFIGNEEVKEPTWVSNKQVWDECLMEKNGVLWIDQRKALLRQLEASGIKPENIYVRENSLQNLNYYSSQRARMLSDHTQDGRFMHAVMYEREGQEKEYEQDYIKKYPVKR